MNYFNYKRSLIHRLNILREKAKTAQGKELDDIIDSIKILEENIRYFNKDKYSYSSKAKLLEEEYRKFCQTSQLWPTINAMANIDIDFEISDFSITTDIKFSKDDFKESVYDFFKNATDKKTFAIFYHFFQNFFQNVCISTSINGTGASFFLPYKKVGIVEMSPKHDFSDLGTLPHEYGHLIQAFLNYNIQMNNKLYPFSEIVSSFFQFISCSYFEKYFENNLAFEAFLESEDILTYARNIANNLSLFQNLELSQIESKEERIKVLNEYVKGNRIRHIDDIFSDYPYVI